MANSKIAFANLRAEMARLNITLQNVADCIGKNRDTTARKLSMESSLSLSEAFTISKNLFQGADLRYLFQELTGSYLAYPESSKENGSLT